METINNLIFHLTALQNYAKDLHYNIPDYSIHLFADRVQEELSDFIDEIKESCILAKDNKLLASAEYLLGATKLIPSVINISELKNLIIDTLDVLEQIDKKTIGDDDIFGKIGSNLQNSLGIINILEK